MKLELRTFLIRRARSVTRKFPLRVLINWEVQKKTTTNAFFVDESLGNFELDDDPIISVSTANEKPANFELLVKHRKDFLVQSGVVYNLEISPSTPM